MINVARRIVLSLLLGLAALGLVPQAMANEQGAARAITQLADRAIQTVAVPGITLEERNQRFRTLFVDSFDIPEISKFVVGRHWRTATDAQKSELIRLFEDVQVYTWARHFASYAGEGIQVLGVGSEGANDFAVDSQINRANGQPPIAVSWRVRQTGDVYKILDIKVEGASMAQTHRSDYASVMSSRGGVDGLIEALKQKIQQLKSDGR